MISHQDWLFPFLSALNTSLVKNNGRIDTKGYFYSLQIIYFFFFKKKKERKNFVSRCNFSRNWTGARKRSRVRVDWNSEGYLGFRRVSFNTGTCNIQSRRWYRYGLWKRECMSHFESFFSLLGGFWYIAEIRIVYNIHKILNVPPFWNISFEKEVEMSEFQYNILLL